MGLFRKMHKSITGTDKTLVYGKNVSGVDETFQYIEKNVSDVDGMFGVDRRSVPDVDGMVEVDRRSVPDVNGAFKYVRKRAVWRGVVVVCLLACLSFSACGASADEEKNTIVMDDNSEASTVIVDENEEGSETANDLKTMTVSYVDSDWTDLSNSDINVEPLASTESMIDTVMNSIITEPEDTTKVVPVAPGMEYQRYNYDGEGTVTVIFNIDSSRTDAYTLNLSKKAFTLSLCRIDGVNSVTFEMHNIVTGDETISHGCNENSFADVDDANLDAECGVMVYFGTLDGEGLLGREINVDMSDAISVEKQIIEALKTSSGDDTEPTLPSDTYIVSLSVNDGVCYIEFSREFLSNAVAKTDVAMYSVINSLTSLSYIDNVNIMVEGVTDNEISEKVQLAVTYGPDYSLCR